MPRTSLLRDEIYSRELDRMRMMTGFPELPAARQQMIRTMRSITLTDEQFLHRLVTHFVDNAECMPSTQRLLERASVMRSKPHGSQSNADCPRCGGTGYVHGTRTVSIPGMQPYEAEYSERCTCAPVEQGAA